MVLFMADVVYKPPIGYDKKIDTPLILSKKDLFTELSIYGAKVFISKTTASFEAGELIYTVPEDQTLFIQSIAACISIASVNPGSRLSYVFVNENTNRIFQLDFTANLVGYYTLPIIIPLKFNSKDSFYQYIDSASTITIMMYGFLIDNSRIPLFL